MPKSKYFSAYSLSNHGQKTKFSWADRKNHCQSKENLFCKALKTLINWLKKGNCKTDFLSS
ncbi:MAG: hypothetical protein EBS19_00075 [Spirochaetia bacterium]|nr:hypothetical protein [Spirochaetia bacterium]